MAEITLKGNPVHTIGTLPGIGTEAPAFTLVSGDLSEIDLKTLSGKTVILNIFPSVDTAVCALSVKRFHQDAARLENVAVVCVSADLPFAMGRFCGAEGIEGVMSGSVFRTPEFGTDYGVTITDGPLAGLLSRAVVVIDGNGKVAYTEQVGEIADEPDYDAALSAVKKLAA